jgi:hypothetical protein
MEYLTSQSEARIQILDESGKPIPELRFSDYGDQT